MPSDDYSAISGGGALRLKGGKVTKKKKRKEKSDLEKNLSTGESSSAVARPATESRKKVDDDDHKERESPERQDRDEEETGDRFAAQKTESERQFEEIKRKRVSPQSNYTIVRNEPADHLFSSSSRWPKRPRADRSC
jgi:protein FAM32A